MFDKFKKVFKKDLPEEKNEPYVFIPETEINEEFKRKIVELERLAEDLAKNL